MSKGINRIILHWTAGTYVPNAEDRKHYHGLIDGNARRHIAVPIERNAYKLKHGYAAHTRNCNTGSIGISMCAMGGSGVRERPFAGGKYPLLSSQWHEAAKWIAELCREYDITVTPKTVLTHAEVQTNLGIAQRGKWDIARLPWAANFDTARECGDLLRKMVMENVK